MWQIKRSNRTRKLTAVLVAAIVGALALSGCGKDKDGEKVNTAEIVATYKDGGKVTRGEYDSFVGSITFFQPMYAQFAGDPTFQEHMIKQLVAFRVLDSKADEQSKKDAEAKTKEQMDQLTAYFAQSGSKDALNEQLKQVNITQDDLRNYIRQSMVVLSDAEKKVKDEDVKAKYDENAKNNAYDVATVSHILVSLKDETRTKDIRTKEEALARAKEIKQKLDNGGDFAALAKEYSDDPGSKDNGGTYEDADINDWVDGFKQAAASLPLNKVSDPVESEFGYHIMRVDSRKTKTFDEMKAELKAELAENSVMTFIENDLPALMDKIDTDKLPKAQPSAQVPAP